MTTLLLNHSPFSDKPDVFLDDRICLIGEDEALLQDDLVEGGIPDYVQFKS